MVRSSSGKNHRHPIQIEYSRLAKEYDTRWDHYVKTTLRETLKRIDIHAGEKLLDVGCGTGVLLETLEKARPDIELSGVDPTEEMLEMARKRVSPKIQLEQGWAEELPFEADSFHVVVSCNVFHYIRQPADALKEVMRVLKPSGRLFITDWCDDYVACRICDIFLRMFNEAHFKTYRKKECRDLLLQAGFSRVTVESYKISWLWGMMTAAAYKKDG